MGIRIEGAGFRVQVEVPSPIESLIWVFTFLYVVFTAIFCGPYVDIILGYPPGSYSKP